MATGDETNAILRGLRQLAQTPTDAGRSSLDSWSKGRTFRRYIERYEEDGLEVPVDKRIAQISHRRPSVDEFMALLELYQNRHQEWNACHFPDWYARQGGTRSYTRVKNRWQEAKLIPMARRTALSVSAWRRQPFPA